MKKNKNNPASDFLKLMRKMAADNDIKLDKYDKSVCESLQISDERMRLIIHATIKAKMREMEPMKDDKVFDVINVIVNEVPDINRYEAIYAGMKLGVLL